MSATYPPFDEITVVVDGAVEETEIFWDETEEYHYCMQIRDEAAGHGYPVEIYRVAHEGHTPDDECECVQYAQSHHPIYRFNSTD